MPRTAHSFSQTFMPSSLKGPLSVVKRICTADSLAGASRLLGHRRSNASFVRSPGFSRPDVQMFWRLGFVEI